MTEPNISGGSIVMGELDHNLSHPSAGVRPFPSTHWSVVLAAGDGASPNSADALETICRKYWRPLYAFVRRRGYGLQDAEDLTQEFLERFIEKRYLGLANPRRGRFRSFFLTALEHFLSDERDRANAAKRGGGRKIFSLDIEQADRWGELADDLTPQKIYEQCWAESLLAIVLERLSAEYAATEKGKQFALLKQFLWGRDGATTYGQIAEQLAMTESAVKTAVHRLRKRYAQLLRHEVAQTVSTAEELEEELCWLRAAFE